MQEKIEGGKLVAEHMLRAEEIVALALAETTAFKLALVAAQSKFTLQPAIFDKLISNVEVSEVAILQAQRSQKRAHLGVLRIRADEGMDDLPFGCDKSCFPASFGRTSSSSLTADQGGVHVLPWLSSSDSNSSFLPPVAMRSGEAEHRSGLQA
jgi:hypothetical protein